MILLNETIARKALEIVDAGLVAGLGRSVPGEMCGSRCVFCSW